MKKYLISVVIPIHNVEGYIDDAMDSLINQSIGFKNIEVILIDDGSTDNSAKVCNKYTKKYKNVNYYYQKNQGVSQARNNGKEKAIGKYINFLDADDKWEYDAFEKAIKVLENDKTLNIVSIRRKKFELLDEYTQFDYMFKSNREVNIFDNYECIQVACTSVIFRTNIIKNYKFDKNLRISEDAKFMLEVMLNEKKVYLISDSIYFYRIRQSNDSAIQKMLNTMDWYSYTSKNVFEYSYNYSKKLYNKILPYVKYFVMYHLRGKFVTKPLLELSEKDETEHKTYLLKLLDEIEDNIILEQRKMSILKKLHVLNIKHNCDVNKDIEYKNSHFRYKDIIINQNDEPLIKIIDIHDEDEKLIIEMITPTFVKQNMIYYKTNFFKHKVKLLPFVLDDVKYFKEFTPKYNKIIITCNNNGILKIFINNKEQKLQYKKIKKQKKYLIELEDNYIKYTYKKPKNKFNKKIDRIKKIIKD